MALKPVASRLYDEHRSRPKRIPSTTTTRTSTTIDYGPLTNIVPAVSVPLWLASEKALNDFFQVFPPDTLW